MLDRMKRQISELSNVLLEELGSFEAFLPEILAVAIVVKIRVRNGFCEQSLIG